MKLVLTGDLHLGRRSSLLGEGNAGAHRAAGAWERVVQLAVEEQAAAVLIAGDLVDQDNSFYEARRPLRDGLDRLQAAGLMAYAVAGNHDAVALSYTASQLDHPALRLLGRGGEWEVVALEHDGETVELLGWSFPTAVVEASPVPARWPAPPPGVPSLGLLHAELDASRSRYAPVATAALAAAGRDLWVCGHVHGPRQFEVDGRLTAMYVGSPQALDPGEPGAHGAWLLDLRPGAPIAPQFRPLSTVRYESPTIDLTGVADKADWDRRVQASLDDVASRLAGESAPWLEVLALRPVFTGDCGLGPAMADWYQELAAAEPEAGGPLARVLGRYTDATAPPLDLASLAGGAGPPAKLARLLLELDTRPPGPLAAALVARAAARLADLDRDASYLPVAQQRETDHQAEAASRLRQQARRLLTALLAAKEAV